MGINIEDVNTYVEGFILIYSKNIIKKWELWGIAWIIIVGTLLHFTFEWSGNSKIVALFSVYREFFKN